MLKIFLFVMCLAFAQSANLPALGNNQHGHASAQLTSYTVAPAHATDFYTPPHYNYEYGVHDSHTGDVKSQQESRQGDTVRGSYTVNEADGTRRVVHYSANDHTGFNAVVQHEGHSAHPQNYQQFQNHQTHQQSQPSSSNNPHFQANQPQANTHSAYQHQGHASSFVQPANLNHGEHYNYPNNQNLYANARGNNYNQRYHH